jgi:hypothetical protein
MTRWWASRPVGLIYVGKEICSGDMVERCVRIRALDKKVPPKVMRFPVGKETREQARKHA